MSSRAPLRIIVADDEPLSRASLKHALEADDVTVVGEASSGAEALALVRKHHADVIFLDIRMPGVDGLGVARQLQSAEGPAVIFVTGHMDHAVSAFDAEAIDYLVKPFDSARLNKALDRARTVVAQRRALRKQRDLLTLLQDERPVDEPRLQTENAVAPEQFAIRDGKARKFVALQSIDWIESYGNYAKIHIGDRAMLHRETMHALEQQLAPMRFARVHRAAIVNLSRITEVKPGRTGQLWVVVNQRTTLRVGRRYRANVDWLGRI